MATRPSYFDTMALIRRIVSDRGHLTVLGNVEFWLEGEELCYSPATQNWDVEALKADLEKWHKTEYVAG